MQETEISSGLANSKDPRDGDLVAAAPLASGATPVALNTGGGSVEALQAELAKWRERVPKLAGALRERTTEVEALKAELQARSEAAPAPGNPPGTKSSGIQARDTLIEELEAKVRALGSKYQDAEGQLHARDVEISSLRQEAAEWREKWQSVTASLDQQADSSDLKDRELQRLQKELDELLGLQESQNGRIKKQDLELTALRERSQSLESRNANLFETTELANRQIETLGENLEHLRSELKASKAEIAAKEAEAGGSAKAVEDLKGQLASRDHDIEFLHGHVEEKRTQITALEARITELEPLQAANGEALEQQARLNGLLEERTAEIAGLTERLSELGVLEKSLKESREKMDALDAELNDSIQVIASRDADLRVRDTALETLKQEANRLEEVVARAEEATGRFEAERRQLSEQMEELRKRNQHLESQLSERSDLVVGLEQEKSAITDRSSSLEVENQRLSEALEKAQRAAAGNADHIAQVDARLERQKQLMENLEEEFAQVQEEYADAVKTHQRQLNENAAELAELRERESDDDTEVLKVQMTELETALAESQSALTAAQSLALEQQQRAENLVGEIDRLKAQDDEARRQLAEKVEKLEKQLHKQSTETAAAEEAAAAARAALEEQKEIVSRVPDEVTGENTALQAEVIKLEGMVRERTEQLNKLRWQQDMIEKQPSDGTDSKMLVVLNQQLASSREDNQRLREQVRELQARPEAITRADDLAQIRGVGPKLVKQLRKLGISQFDQIATLSESDLDDVQHPLHAMKGRILKDDWIRQAARLGGSNQR